MHAAFLEVHHYYVYEMACGLQFRLILGLSDQSGSAIFSVHGFLNVHKILLPMLTNCLSENTELFIKHATGETNSIKVEGREFKQTPGKE